LVDRYTQNIKIFQLSNQLKLARQKVNLSYWTSQ